VLSNERLKRRFQIRRLNGVNIDAVVAGSKSKLNFWLTPEREAAAHPAREVASRAFHGSVSHFALQAKLKEGPDRGRSYRCLKEVSAALFPKQVNVIRPKIDARRVVIAIDTKKLRSGCSKHQPQLGFLDRANSFGRLHPSAGDRLGLGAREAFVRMTGRRQMSATRSPHPVLIGLRDRSGEHHQRTQA